MALSIRNARAEQLAREVVLRCVPIVSVKGFRLQV